MNLESFTNSNLVESLGWTLVHSLWQIALIALILFGLLKIFHKQSANFRYLMAVFTLSLAFILPIVTFVNLSYDKLPNFIQSENLQAHYTLPENKNILLSEEFQNLKNSENQIARVDPTNSTDIDNLPSFFSAKLSENLSYLVGLWFFGVIFFALRLIGGFWQLQIFKTREVFAPDGEWQAKFDQLCDRLKITQTVGFLRSNLIETPVVIGWLKPIVLIPTSVFLQISPQELETIIAHELIHIRRYDTLVNFAQSFIEILFFYHPCAWWISSAIRKEREFAADEAVIKIIENSHIIYANALANIEELRLMTNQKLPSLATAANGGNLMQRIAKILQTKGETKLSTSAWSGGLVLIIVLAVLLTTFSFKSATVLVEAQKKTADKKLAIGFVGIPPLDRTANPPKDSDATMRLMIEKLKSHKIPAIGFLTGSMISDGEKLFPIRANTVRLWRDAGFEVGIGNFKHVWFYETPYEEYVAGVEKNEEVAKKLLGDKDSQIHYFSYPYLNTGKNAADRDRFEAWLLSRGIKPVKYTIDNNEWVYSYAYDMARNDNDLNTMKEIQTEFLDYMSKMFDHFEKYSKEMFGRDINQTMVLTPSRLVADSADDLFGMIENRGYKFVPMDEAQSDEAYGTAENFYGKSGISWFERWQMAKGKKLFDEPQVNADVWKTWKEKNSN